MTSTRIVYILHSLKSDKYYIGETADINERLAIHNNPLRNTNSTISGIPWELYFSMDCPSRKVALAIERHIKRMKSRKYIEDLKRHPDLSSALLKKYTVAGSPR